MCTIARPAIQKIVQGRNGAGARYALRECRWRAVMAPSGSAFADVRHTLATKILRIGYDLHVVQRFLFLYVCDNGMLLLQDLPKV